MNLDKSTKRIAKRVKNGFQGYPQITITYLGQSESCASEVVVGFIIEEEHKPKKSVFSAKVMPVKMKRFKPH